MANTLSLGSGNWGAKESLLLGYYEDGGKFFPETFDVTRATPATRVDKDGLIVTDTEIVSGELVTNGDFATDSDWTKQANWSIGFGKANSNGTGLIYQTAVSYVDGKTYKVTFNANITSGSGTVRLGNTSTSTAFVNGLNEFYLQTDVSNTTKYIFFQGNSFIGSIDNVSVIEVNQKNLARIDYTDSTKGVLLTEPLSTNLIKDSNVLNRIGGGAVELNSGISPDGTQNAVKLIFGAALNDAALMDISGSPAVANTIHTFSVYAKSLVGDGQFGVRIDTDTQSVVGNQSFTATTEWVRYSFQFTTDALSSTFASNSRMRKRGTPNNEILFYGLQMEKLSYATSIIPTYGSTVTRNQDQVTNGGDVKNFNSEEGVLYAEIAALEDDLTYRGISLNDGTNANSLSIRYRPNSNRVNGIIKDDNGANFQLNFDISDITQFNKIALKYKSGDTSMYINGTEVVTSSLAFSFTSALNDLSFNRGDSGDKFFGKTKNVQVFNEALTDSELVALTTI